MRAIAALAILASAATVASAAVPTKRQARSSAYTAQVSAAKHVIPSSGVLNGADLVAIARLKAKASGDEFADEPTLAYLGREFTIDLPPRSIVIHYNNESHTLVGSTPTYDDGIDLVAEETEARFAGQNAFGAKAIVTKRRGNDYGIWLPGASYNRKPVVYSAPMPGTEARELSKALRLRLSGTIVKASGPYAEGISTVYKKSLLADATVSDPIDVWITRYLVAVAFTKAEWIDGRTGAVLETQDLVGYAT